MLHLYRMKKLILDVDTGTDDAMAIMMALTAPGVEVVGITCTHGNTKLENVVVNTLRVLRVCGRLDIPVYRGCPDSVLGKKRTAGDFHGKDGMGDVPDPDPPSLDLLQKRRAAQAMIKIVKGDPGEVSIVATAPLTNLAVAAQLDASFPKKVKSVYVMGGNIDSRGNTTVCGEFNFVADPEAAYIVLNQFPCPIYIVPWESSCRNSLPWSFCDEWFGQDTDKARFLKEIYGHTRKILQNERYQKEQIVPGFNTCDCYTMAAAIDDTVVTETEEVAVTVELEGTYTRGMMVVDSLELLKKKHKATILKKFDLDKFMQMLMKSVY